MSRIICITSGKGGVGKTSVCCNLGYALAKQNQKVLLIDTDFGLNNLDVVMGIENKIVFDLIDVLQNKCRAKQAIIQDFFTSNLYIFPSNHIGNLDILDTNKLKDVINELEFMFDFILVDCPAGIDGGFFRAIGISNEAIIVTTPHLSAIRDADKINGFLKNSNILDIHLIVNRIRGDLIISNESVSPQTIEKYLNIDLVGAIPESDQISSQLNISGPINEVTDVSEAFSLSAKKLLGISNEIYDCSKKYKGLLGNIKRSLRKIV